MNLPPFDENTICRMCGTVRGPESPLSISYCPGSDPNKKYQKDRCRSGIEPEHFHRTCQTCQYSWVEGVLDLGEPPVASEAPNYNQYSPLQPCLKCGLAPVSMMKPQVKYCQGGESCIMGIEGAHMHRECVQCRYAWIEAPLDQDFMIGVRQEE
jgi:hypothetical protein